MLIVRTNSDEVKARTTSEALVDSVGKNTTTTCNSTQSEDSMSRFHSSSVQLSSAQVQAQTYLAGIKFAVCYPKDYSLL